MSDFNDFDDFYDEFDDLTDVDPDDINGGEFITNFPNEEKEKYRRAIVASGHSAKVWIAPSNVYNDDGSQWMLCSRLNDLSNFWKAFRETV